MKKEVKIAHLFWSQGNHGVSVVRMTNPIVDGRFTGYGWYDMPCHTALSPQEYANSVGEVIFYTDFYGESGYVYPKEVEKIKVQDVIIDLSTFYTSNTNFYTSNAKLSELSSYIQKARDLAGNGNEVVLTGAGPVWLYLKIAHALHGKAKSLVYRSPVTGDVVIFDHSPD